MAHCSGSQFRKRVAILAEDHVGLIPEPLPNVVEDDDFILPAPDDPDGSAQPRPPGILPDAAGLEQLPCSTLET